MLNGVAFGNNTFVAVGVDVDEQAGTIGDGNILRSTDNGASFDNVTSPTANYFMGVTF